ncbi:MAG: YidC/Oxa1 family membrane protein insertase [Oscillospiraceae bacterium]|nr:YidC/Oxa1 family membrane protein insertase [Oscillospiraceae bacterium]
MSLFSILGTLCIGPLKLLFETIFHVAYGVVGTPGPAIIFLSLAMNVLVLPLYRRADAMQEQARDTEARLREGVTHIKKTFSGNERMMMLQTYYRQNDYSPANALRGSVSLLLEIPFFMAAYQFLSQLELLRGVSFGPIADLGAPDGLLTLFGRPVNLLPVLMTLINFLSSAIYLRGFPLKTKLQLYAMALFFLWFLYDSPSGLVFYWTLNNLFSLGKNVFYRLKHPKRVLAVLTALLGAGLLLLWLGADAFGLPTLRQPAVLLTGLVLLLPAALRFIGPRLRRSAARRTPQPERKRFLLAALFLTVLTGLLIPSTYIAASPEEYVDAAHFYHPAWYIVSAAALAAGTFLLWLGVFYWLASPRGKLIFERAACAACAAAAVDYMCFGRNLGILSNTLQFENGLSFSALETWLNLLAVAAAAAAAVLLVIRLPRQTGLVLAALTVAIIGLSGVNTVKTLRSVGMIWHDDSGTEPHFTLSRTEQNVAVIFLDRALGEDFPYLLNEKPELKDALDGFTYYSNVISFGGHTNFGAPALMGGYEYTPVELNRRDTEKLVDKHNESLKVMPVLFSQNGFDVTVCDAPYANYRWIPDLSIYDEYPGIHKYLTRGYFGDTKAKLQAVELNKRNFFCFSLMKVLPAALQGALYDSGNYHRAGEAAAEPAFSQIAQSLSVADGLDKDFMESYEALRSLKRMTRISAEARKRFVFYYNDLPHEPMLLQEPEYIPAVHVDNREYDAAHRDRFTLDGRTLQVHTLRQMTHYQTNMATLLQIAGWLDYLKEAGVYDNTKIIIVADHGYYLDQTEQFRFPEYVFSNGYSLDIANYFPLLLVKDFNAHGFTVSEEFMTNADVPTIAFEGCVEQPVNPFTGKPINSDEKTAHDQFIITYHAGWDTETNNGNCFFSCPWAAVTNNIWDRSDWQFLETHTVLKEHRMP